MAPLKLTGQAMRRNESLCEMGRDRPECAGIRANKSAASLVEEAQQQHRSQQQRASRSLLLEACALHLEKLIEPAPGSQQPSQQQQPQQSSSSQPYRRCAFPTDAAVLNYIGTIASRLSLPNSCVIAMVIYVERLASAPYFTLTACNWQPSIVAAFVVAAKLFLDEQVWNEVGECPHYSSPHSAATLTLSALADRISCACSKSQSGEEWEIRPSSRRSATGRRASVRPQQHRDDRSRTESTGFLLMASVGVLPQADWLPDQRTSLRVRGPCLSAAGERESSRESEERAHPPNPLRSGRCRRATAGRAAAGCCFSPS